MAMSSAESGEPGLPPLGGLGTPPAPGVRFRELDPRYAACGNHEIAHCIHLPSDWRLGGRFPLLVEFAGNRYEERGADGTVESWSGTCAGARMGYFLSGRPGSAASGSGAIWVTVPFIACDRAVPDDLTRHREADRWYGDATVSDDALGQRLAAEYLRRVVLAVCQHYGGDPARVVLCGFSRGAIAGGFVGRSDDATANLFRGFVLHAHHDASGQSLSPADPGGRRCARAVGRPSFLSAGELDSGRASTEQGAAALRAAGAEAEVHIVPGLGHSDAWVLDGRYHERACAEARDRARRFLARVFA